MADPLALKKTRNKFYSVWVGLRRRCNGDKHVKSSQTYLDRGITYCDEWKSFDNFYRDMASTYKTGLSLDRIDNDRGYSKENCRWATPKEQSNNTSRNRKFTINGVTKNLAQWCEETDVKPSAVRARFYCMGWDIEKALFTPTNSHKTNLGAN